MFLIFVFLLGKSILWSRMECERNFYIKKKKLFESIEKVIKYLFDWIGSELVF